MKKLLILINFLPLLVTAQPKLTKVQLKDSVQKYEKLSQLYHDSVLNNSAKMELPGNTPGNANHKEIRKKGNYYQDKYMDARKKANAFWDQYLDKVSIEQGDSNYRSHGFQILIDSYEKEQSTIPRYNYISYVSRSVIHLRTFKHSCAIRRYIIRNNRGTNWYRYHSHIVLRSV